MRLLSVLALVVCLCVVVSGQTPLPKVADLTWLAGCWEMKVESRGLHITEMWMKPAGNAIVGSSRTMRGGTMIDYEFLRIVEDASGIAYISRPSANKADTSFKLVKATPAELVFENLAHDYPQRIIYRVSGDKLTARIEGTRDGKLRGSDFPYFRVACN
jgi:hypothetical protein